MSWRKNVFSYLMWAFYTILVGTLMMGIGNLFRGDGFPSCFEAVFAVMLMAASGGAAFLLRRFAPKLNVFFDKRKKLCLAAEAGLLAVLLVMGAALRAAGFQDAGTASEYYGLAEVTMGQDSPRIAHGAVHIYVWILHLVFLFLGNHYAVGIMVQIVFQSIAALLFYCQVRKYVGRVAALAAAGFFTCAPYMVQAGLTLSPDMLYLCLLAAAGAVVAALCSGGSRPFFFFLAGAVSSVTAYLDVAGAALLLFSVSMIFCVEREMPEPDRKGVSCLCCALGFAFGFAGCAAASSLAGAKSFGGALREWFQLYTPEGFLAPAASGIQESRVEGLVLAGLMALGIYSFWFERKRERLAVHMSAVCAVILGGRFGIFTPEMPGMTFLYLLFVLMAGIGLQQCFGGEAMKARPASAEGAEQAAVLQAAAGSREAGKKRKDMKNQEARKTWKGKRSQEARKERGDKPGQEVWEEQGDEPGQEVRQIQEDMRNDEERVDQGRQEMQEQSENKMDTLPEDKTEKKEKKEIHYLENPLPLPKKHEKKVLDYDYPVADDDDFDI